MVFNVILISGINVQKILFLYSILIFPQKSIGGTPLFPIPFSNINREKNGLPYPCGDIYKRVLFAMTPSSDMVSVVSASACQALNGSIISE
jgi:hypothetical protein